MLFIVRWALPFLLTLFPLETLAEIAVVVLRRLAKKTESTFDDELVAVLERRFDIPPTPEVATNVSERNH